MATFAAIDLGAQSGRVAVGRFDGDRLSVSEVHRFPNVPVRTRNTLNWDILRLYQDVTDGLRAAGREAGRVDSVAADSWAVDFGLLDRNGRLLQNPVHYRDDRRARAVEGVLAEVPARDLYERTGIQLMPINTVFELGAMAAEPDPVLEAAETLLFWSGLVLVGKFLPHLIRGSFDDGKQLFDLSAIVRGIGPLEISLANLPPRAGCTLGILLNQLFKASLDKCRERDLRRWRTGHAG